MEEKKYYVYILLNKWNTTSYIGITSTLSSRIWQHKIKAVPGFTSKYNLTKLVYYEIFDTPYEAISREKQLKRWSRIKKLNLIRKLNQELRDLSEDL